MGITLEVAAALLCMLGLTAAGWWLLGRLLRPIPGQVSWILLPGYGRGEQLEQTVRGYMFLRGLGIIRNTILIADLGLNGEGREIALRLCARWPNVVLWPAQDLDTWLNYFT